MPETLISLEASAPRRVFAMAVLVSLGGLLVYIGLARPPSEIGWQVFLLILGALTLVLSGRFWRATASAIELREDGLYDRDGRLICALSEIERLDRGMFAFKPSNGFLVRLRAPGARAWAPGLWWRLGRQVGVGGVTPGAQGKILADMLSAALADRHGPAD
jgi:hypothetical protein